MGSWRLLRLETYDAFMNMAVDEAILTARIANIAPNTLRFYCWKPSAVSIGKFQNIQNEVQLENCKRLGVDVVRRITGGGAVYHDAEDEITYSLIADKKDLNATDITSAYTRVYAGIAEALAILCLKSDYNEGNAKTCPNLTVNGKKISGSAQTHKKGIVLQHGTLLIDVNLERMFTILRVSWAKTCMQIVNIAKDKITSIKKETHKNFTIAEVEQALIEGFQKALNTKLTEGKLTAYERELAEKLYKQKYTTNQWNHHGRNKLE